MDNFLKNLFSKFRKTILLILAFVLLTVVWASIGALSRMYEFRDDDPERGAAVVSNDIFGDSFTNTKYLDQGWDEADSLWFYNTTQGSNLLPYDFFLVLEQKDSEQLFRDNENINRYRYLPQNPTKTNPHGLPVGMTRDVYQGKEYMGFTCAACHTSQINYDGIGIRIDGGPAMSDMENFMIDLADAMYATLENEPKLSRLVEKVLEFGNYDDRAEIEEDLRKYAQRIKTYTIVNEPQGPGRPPTHYGYARLDAFGRIYNRVLEHVMSAEQLRQLLAKKLAPQELKRLMEDIKPVLSGDDRDHIIERIQGYMSTKQILALRDEIYNPADAPVSYPFLWDIPQHDYVQWNGVVQNAGLGPMGRNAGQVIGVFGTLNWQEKSHTTLSCIIIGRSLTKPCIEFTSSLDIRNLRRVEDHLRDLKSPLWPEDDLGEFADEERLARGEKLFDDYCASCHRRIDRDSVKRRVIADMEKLSEIKTDPKMANNSVDYIGYSGILENRYVGTDVGDILLQKQAPAAALLTSATGNVLITPDPDKYFFQRWAERLFDFAITFFDNEVKPSIKRGRYNPDTTADPYASLRAYKGRSLNGIWATAPYLHNGSVPTLYHLLLPKKRDGDPDDGEYRPDEFMTGSREFKPEYVGFKWDGYEGFKFRTEIPGNSNAGHEYAAGRTPQPDGRLLPALNPEQRGDLLEYLKTL